MIRKQHPWLYLIRFSICSNGLLYNTPTVQNFLKKYANFLSFSVSVDGNKATLNILRDKIDEAIYLNKQESVTPAVVIQGTSSADEILKYKKLCDEGIITEEEFNMKKKQLME